MRNDGFRVGVTRAVRAPGAAAMARMARVVRAAAVARMAWVALAGLAVAWGATSCNGDGADPSFVQIHNDFDNPEMSLQPPWTICKASYRGVEFDKIEIGQTSAALEVGSGLDYVLMVAAWDDPECNPDHCLPIASRNEEEVVEGQTRVIAINLANHQGPCPPVGVEPIPEDLYNRILELWPEYNFRPYDQRTENPQCQH